MECNSSSYIKTMSPATCFNVMQGTVHDIMLSANGGKPPYTYSIILDGTVKVTSGPVQETSYTFTGVQFTESLGSHTLVGRTTDGCTPAQISSDQCTNFNIYTPVGSISCTTIPVGASVSLDGLVQPGAITPVTLQGVSPGSHTVTFDLAGYNSCPVSVNVTTGLEATASCTLCLIPSCEFSWLPTSPHSGENVQFTPSDLTLVSHEWVVNGTVYGTNPTITMTFTDAGTYDVQHNGVNACGAICTTIKQVVVICAPLSTTMTFVN